MKKLANFRSMIFCVQISTEGECCALCVTNGTEETGSL